jgi:phosphoglycolate phosphatase-like HAD superfamily hydrolase
VGQTPIDESTEYGAWADWSGVPRHTFSAVFARGGDYREVFQHLRPGLDLHTERQRRAEAGIPEHFDGRDLYPDARECLASLERAGYFVGIAGNRTARADRLLLRDRTSTPT